MQCEHACRTNLLHFTAARGLTNTTLGKADGRAVAAGAYTNFLLGGMEDDTITILSRYYQTAPKEPPCTGYKVGCTSSEQGDVGGHPVDKLGRVGRTEPTNSGLQTPKLH